MTRVATYTGPSVYLGRSGRGKYRLLQGQRVLIQSAGPTGAMVSYDPTDLKREQCDMGVNAKIGPVPYTELELPFDMDLCPHCEGQGAYWDDQTGQPDEPRGGSMITCWQCDGSGLVDTSPCIACGAPVYDHEEDCPVIRAKEEVRA